MSSPVMRLDRLPARVVPIGCRGWANSGVLVEGSKGASMSWSFVRVRSRKTENIRLIHVTAEDSPEVGMPEYYQRFDSVRYIRENYLKRMDLLDRLSEVIERRPARLFVEAGVNDYGGNAGNECR